MLANLSRREADLLIREQVPELAGIVARKLGRVAYAVYAARDFPLGRKGARSTACRGSASTTTTATCRASSWLLELLGGARPAVRVQQLAGAARGGARRRRPRRAALLSRRSPIRR